MLREILASVVKSSEIQVNTLKVLSNASMSLNTDLDMQTHKVINLATPTVSSDAASKGYVDGLVGGAALTAGDGIDITTGVISVKIDGSTLSESASGLKVAAGGITNTEVSASAAIAYSKLALTGSIVNADISASAAIAYSKLSLTGSIVDADISATAAIAYSKLNLSGSIVDGDISASAAISYSKLALANSIVNADISSTAAIAYSKLNLTGSIVNSDIATGAAIAYSKLSLTGSIVNADISASAAIAYSKLAALGGSTNAVLVQDAGGHVSASAIISSNLFLADGTVTATAAFNLGAFQINNLADPTLGTDAATKSYVDTGLNTKLSLSGGTMTGNIAMGGNLITGLGAPVSANDAVRKAYVDGLVSGIVWYNPILDPDLIDDSLTAPPGSPVANTVYLIGASATGAWAGLDGHVVYWNGASWVDILGRAVIVGDRFGITMEHGSGSEGGSFVGKHNQIAQITTATPGSYAYTFTVPSDSYAVFVSEDSSQHAGHAYIYQSGTTTWVEFVGPGSIGDGIGLSWSGNTLNINLGAGIQQLPSDEVGIDLYAASGMDLVDPSSGLPSSLTNAQLALKLDGSTLSKSSSGVKVATGGITNNEINASAAIAYSKLNLTGSIVNADIASGAAIDYSKLNLTGSIVDADISASAAIALSKLATLTSNKALVSDGSGVISASTVTATELGYVSGVTSAIQTQLDGKANTALSNLTSTSINQDLVPATDYLVTARNLGSSGTRWSAIYVHAVRTDFLIGLSSTISVNSSLIPSGSLQLGTSGSAWTLVGSAEFTGSSLANTLLSSAASASADAIATKGIDIKSGNKTAGTGNSGDITLQTGTSAGGARGKVLVNALSLDVNSTNIINVADPVNAQDAATKNYVDTKNAPQASWVKYTVSYSALSAAALTNSITLFALGAKQVIHGVVVKHSTAFAGTGITGYTVEVGVTGDLGRYSSAFDVEQAVGSSTAQASADLSPEDFSSSVNILITANSTGANLSAATQGSVDVWVAVATLP